MAQSQRPLLFIFFLTLAILSHALQHFQDFDVSASIKKTRGVFSEQTLQIQQEKAEPTATATSAPSVLSVSLHPRVSIAKLEHKDYHALTLSRLARDSARVNLINSRLQFALSNFTYSDLKPVETFIQPEDLQSPVISGVKVGSGEYFARLGVGEPATEYYMVLDTGSDISWLQCQPCSDCYQQSDPIFKPSASSSYRTLPCSSSQCTSLNIYACGATRCLYQVSYGDGSYTVGEFATETLSFGNSGSIKNTAIGCGHDNEGLFIGSAGILGLGGGSLSLPSQIKASSFSYCLVNRDSNAASTLEFNSAPPGDSIFASMVRNPRYDVYFYVDLDGISVGGQKLSIPASIFQVDGSGRGGVIVDSGTAVTRLTTQAYNALRDAFVKYTPRLPKANGFAIFDTCYDLSSMPSVSVPTIALIFSGGKTLTLKGNNYLIPVDDSGKFCLALLRHQDHFQSSATYNSRGHVSVTT